jgi:hypothetical protein
MSDDEGAIREAMASWPPAAPGTLPKALRLMSDDAVFIVP